MQALTLNIWKFFQNARKFAFIGTQYKIAINDVELFIQLIAIPSENQKHSIADVRCPNGVEKLKHPTPEKVEAIKDALRYFEIISGGN